MDTGTITLTRRIQVLVNTDDAQKVHEAFNTLYGWQYACFRAANYIFTHLYLQHQVKDLFYLNGETQVKLADIKKDENGILTSSKLNTTYRVLVQHFKGEIPMTILGNLNIRLTECFNSERAAYVKGERSLRNYKKNIPIPFNGTDMRQWHKTPDEKNFTFNLFGIPLRTRLGRDLDKRVLLEKALAGKIKLCSSSLQLKEARIYLLATFTLEKEKHFLNEAVIAEVALSIDFPLVVSIGKSTHNIGSKEEFLYRRLAIQAARQRVQKGIAYNRGGKGRKKKIGALDRFAETETNYVNNRMHVYSRELIDICVKHHAATLILTDQQDKEAAAKENDFLLRHWSYYALKEKISYKAAKAGISIITE